jgi:glycosyltransferase involved in cell wall biosynthesis
MSGRVPRILFTYMVTRDMQSFTRADYETLASKYYVRKSFYSGKLHGWPDRAAISLGVLSTDAAFAWFGYEHARIAVAAARRLGRPSIVVMGGFEGSDEITPGAPPLEPQTERTRFLLRHATKIIAVSHHLRTELSAIANRPDIEVIHNGVDIDRFQFSRTKENVVISAGFVSRRNLARKGQEVFVRAAEHVPEAHFVLVGRPLDDALQELRKIAANNVTFTGWLPEGELIRLMQRAKVYVQVSSHEAFGCALAEAMACGCVPVVTRRAAIPEVVGDCGHYVEVDDVEGTARGVRAALSDPKLGLRASQRVRDQFPMHKRRASLMRLVEDVFSESPGTTPRNGSF